MELKHQSNTGNMKRGIRRGRKISETAGENKEHRRNESHQGTRRKVNWGRRAILALGDQRGSGAGALKLPVECGEKEQRHWRCDTRVTSEKN